MPDTMTPAEFHAAFTRTLEQRPACKADVDTLHDFLLGQGIDASESPMSLRFALQHLVRHGATCESGWYQASDLLRWLENDALDQAVMGGRSHAERWVTRWFPHVAEISRGLVALAAHIEQED